MKEMEMMMIIYKAVNILNDKVYIGVTTRTLEERVVDHLQKANTNSGHYFQKAIGTYGPEAFTWEQIDTASNTDELAAKEIYYILNYKSFENGYNSDKGGGFKKTVYQYNLDGSFVTSFEDLTSAANAINATKKAVSKACWTVSHTLGGFLWSYDHKEPFKPQSDQRRKGVLQFDLDGKLTDRFASVADANRKTGISKTCIARCCREERKHSGGFLWKYS